MIWSFVTAIIGLGSALVTWWIANSPRIRAQRMLDDIRDLEQRAEDALGRKDMEALAALNQDLHRFREAYRILYAKR